MIDFMLEHIQLYYILSTCVAWYFLIGIPTANVVDGYNIAASLVVSLLFGWIAWWFLIIIYVWVRLHPEEVAQYLRKNDDPRWSDYASRIKPNKRK